MTTFLTRFYHLNRMGRIEGPPMAGILVLAGAAFAAPSLPSNTLLAAFCMYFFCMNYVYLVNGVTDVREDAINSPDRPLASGAIDIKTARIYVNLLFMATVIYPFFVHDSWPERMLVWTILLMGYFYSCPPVRFKRNPPLATLYLVINFNLPIVLGYWMATDTFDIPPFLLSTALLFLANMPLKDYGDRLGDAEAGISNWVSLAGGTRQLLTLSIILSVSGALACYFLLPDQLLYRWLFVALPLLPALNILLHKASGLNMDQMFTHGVRTLMVLATLFTVVRIAV